MVFESVQFNNIEELYQAVYISLTNNDLKKMIGSKLVNIYNRCSVVFKISNVTPFEVFYLKKLTNDNIIIDPEYRNAGLSFKNKIDEASSTFIKLWTKMTDDSDLDSIILPDPSTFLPLSCFRKDVVAIFTGPSLFHIFGTMPNGIFIDAYKSLDNLPSEFIENDEIINIVTNKLASDIYKTIASELNNTDMIPESIVFEEYYKNMKDNVGCLLSHAITPFGVIGINKLTNENHNTVQNSVKMIEEWEKKVNEAYIEDHNGIFFKTTKLVYIVTLPVLTFIELMSHLPMSYLTDIINLKIVTCEPINMSNISIPPKYVNRFVKRYSDYINAYNEIPSEEILSRIIHMPTSKTVSFILTLSLEDISHTLILYENEITDKISGDSENVVKTILDTIKYIKSTSRVVYNQFMF